MLTGGAGCTLLLLLQAASRARPVACRRAGRAGMTPAAAGRRKGASRPRSSATPRCGRKLAPRGRQRAAREIIMDGRHLRCLPSIIIISLAALPQPRYSELVGSVCFLCVWAVINRAVGRELGSQASCHDGTMAPARDCGIHAAGRDVRLCAAGPDGPCVAHVLHRPLSIVPSSCSGAG